MTSKLEHTDDGTILLAGERIGRIFHAGDGSSPPWTLELIETEGRDGTGGRFPTQAEARARAEELLADVAEVRLKVRRRSGR